MSVTRDVVSDLWPLYACGAASADSRALVEGFLRSDPEFERHLRGTLALPVPEPALAPDGEARALARTRDLVHGHRWLRAVRLLALALTGLTLARFVQYSDWNEATRRWVATGVVAIVAWVLYGFFLHRYRAGALRSSG